MGRRVLIVSVLFMIGAIPLMLFAVTAGGPGPSMYALIAYFGFFAIFGNGYVLFGNRLGKSPVKNESPDTFEKFTLYFIRYGGALMFIGIALQLIFHSLVLGFGAGAQLFPQTLPRYETISDLQLVAGLLSGFLLLSAGLFLLFRPTAAIIPMTVGTTIFLLGVAYGECFAGSKDTATYGIFGSYPIGGGLIIWVIFTAAFRLRGTLK